MKKISYGGESIPVIIGTVHNQKIYTAVGFAGVGPKQQAALQEIEQVFNSFTFN